VGLSECSLAENQFNPSAAGNTMPLGLEPYEDILDPVSYLVDKFTIALVVCGTVSGDDFLSKASPVGARWVPPGCDP
jgi:hypothetical protein